VDSKQDCSWLAERDIPSRNKAKGGSNKQATDPHYGQPQQPYQRGIYIDMQIE